MKISFITEKSLNECNPELINKLNNVSSYDELSELEESFGQNEVVDAIFAIAAEESSTDKTLSDDTITDFLWEEYYEHLHEYVRDSFLNRNNNDKEPVLR